MSASSSPYFFVSYSREDTVKQRRLVRGLRKRGLNVWVDIENLTPGTPTWEREIEKAIRGAMGIIVLLSPESNNSEWVRREISFGEQHRKRIFPALIEGEEFASTPLRLSNHQRVDLRTNFEGGLDELTGAIKDYIDVKKDIETQTHSVLQDTKVPKPAFDIRKLGMPALIGVIGLVAISGAVAAISFISNRMDTNPTAPPDVDPLVTEVVTQPVQVEPTGKIIYTCEIQGTEICIINPDGSGWRRLTDSQFANFNATLSPDGESAVYIVSDGTNSEIFELDVGSGNSQRLTALNQNLGSPEISPDNQYIIFHYRAGNDNLQLWLMNRDGSDPHEFYAVEGRDAHDGTWSPDGTQILFAFGRAENNQLYVMDFNGRDPRLLNDSIDTRGRTDWGANNLIVLDMGGPWEHDVYLMNADGSDLHQISPKGTNSQGASLSPDGQWIAFTAYTDVTNKDLASCEIFIMRIDGTDVRQLTNNDYCDFQPRWGN
ncbi:MAG: TIR domain-containing protein [Anaerolineales bacterium]|nr:TIR domain-containing protein [Anaerolineales bacterium]